MDSLDLALRLGTALAIGFLIGLERGWRERKGREGSRTAGIRTFALLGLAGGIVGVLSTSGDRILAAVSFAVVSITLGAYMWREGEREKDLSATGLVAAMITFLLGMLAVLGDQKIAAAAGVATAVLLAGKETLHGWLVRLRWPELRSVLQLAAMTFIALPLLPNTPVDPWGAIVPWQLWLMTVLIAAVSFAGYVASRLAGARSGLLMTALLAGIFASTAATLSLARLSRQAQGHERFLAGCILAAATVMMLRVIVVCGIINLPLAKAIALPLISGAIAIGLLTWVLVRQARNGELAEAPQLNFTNPFELSEVLRFGLLLAAVTVAAVVARQYYGAAGLYSLAAISGLADVDAMTLAAARLPDAMPLPAEVVLITVTVNQIAKAIYAWMAGGSAIGKLTFGGMIAGLAAAAVAWFLV
jgi:uncharacterized membrane protein (DUF4010 family)